jgi:hypothetical protein
LCAEFFDANPIIAPAISLPFTNPSKITANFNARKTILRNEREMTVGFYGIITIQ